jgi:hypothetical protein
MRHPANGEAWKFFEKEFDWFPKDAPNIKLGIAIDGFNPFGNMSSSYSTWPFFSFHKTSHPGCAWINLIS